ncbi:actin organization and endocytosis protein [Phlyctochytrium bullatum]|nr:actin organization and endocytosis protein [Phlyctochytrium bullatum]
MTPQDLQSLEQKFVGANPDPVTGLIGPMEARNVFLLSKLGQDELAQIWELSAVRRGSGLSFPEFAVAMFLIRLRLRGQPVPPTLPEKVVKQVQSSIEAIEASHRAPPPSSNVPTLAADPFSALVSRSSNSSQGFGGPVGQPPSIDPLASLGASPLVSRSSSTSQGFGAPAAQGFGAAANLQLAPSPFGSMGGQIAQSPSNQSLSGMGGAPQIAPPPFGSAPGGAFQMAPPPFGSTPTPQSNQVGAPWGGLSGGSTQTSSTNLLSGPGFGSSAPLTPSKPADPLASLASLGSSPMTTASKVTDGFAGPLQSRAAAIMSPKPSRADGSVPWAVTAAEKQQYDSIFKVWDPTNTGFISGDRARQVFSQSGLPDNILAHIWTLADTQSAGKLNSNEFAVAMHLIYKKLNGQDLPKVLPPELVPPSTRELDSLASMMKAKLLSDVATRKVQTPSAFSSTSSLVDDPLFAGFSAKPSYSSAKDSKSEKEREEQERKRLADELEQKKRDLASTTNHIEVNEKLVKELQRDIDRSRREAANVHDEVVWTFKSRTRLIDNVKSRGPTSVSSPTASTDYSAELSALDRELHDLLRECRQLERAKADRQIEQLKKSGGGGGGGDVASQAAALLAARMAALGISAPVLDPQAPAAASPSVASPTLAADIAAVESARDARERELDEAASRISTLLDKARAAVPPTSGFSSGASGYGVLSRLRRWEPTTDEKLKYMEGYGLRSVDAKALVEEFNKSLPPATILESAVPNERPITSTFSPTLSSFAPSTTDAPTSVASVDTNPFGASFSKPVVPESVTTFEQRSGASAFSPTSNVFASYATELPSPASAVDPVSNPFGLSFSKPAETSSPFKPFGDTKAAEVDSSPFKSFTDAFPEVPFETGLGAGDSDSSAAAKLAALNEALAQTEAVVKAAALRAQGPTSAFRPSATGKGSEKYDSAAKLQISAWAKAFKARMSKIIIWYSVSEALPFSHVLQYQHVHGHSVGAGWYRSTGSFDLLLLDPAEYNPDDEVCNVF